MQKIHPLPESVVAKISAGEVIERPAYAVKELIENSIDAKSTVIEIHIEEAGLKRITVQDNGEGMSRKDIELSFLPHTTSKLRDEHELIGVRTLGFRGEALSSIAAISTMTIRSRLTNDPGGTEITLRNGAIEHIAPVGTPPGTTIIVDHLFHTVPARKKFLKSDKTELRIITDVVTHFSLSYPAIHFVLTHNKKIIFDLPAKNDLIDRVKFFLGNSIFENLIPIKFEDGFIKLSGFIGKPQIASKLNQKQFLFINNRSVTDRMISLSVKEAFATLLPASQTPIFLINLTLPPEIVDVNVHPRKEQISLINSRQIFDGIKQAVTETLNENNLTFKLAKFKEENSARTGETTSSSGSFLKQNVLPWNRNSAIDFKPTTKLIQIHQTYILSQTKDGVVFIDQHASHERILYEEFLKVFKEEKYKSEYSELTHPIHLNLSLNESQVLEEQQDFFKKSGFIIEHFQGSSFIIRAIPVIFHGRNIEKIIQDILSDLENDTPKSIDDRTQRMLAFLACRAAVKAGDVLSERHMKDILTKLEKTPNNSTCPHGRPTRIPLTIDELNKLFRR